MWNPPGGLRTDLPHERWCGQEPAQPPICGRARPSLLVTRVRERSSVPSALTSPMPSALHPENPQSAPSWKPSGSSIFLTVQPLVKQVIQTQEA